MPTLGVRVPNSGPLATSANIIAVGDAANSNGFEALWTHDHISWTPELLTHFAAGSIEACDGQDPNFFESLSTVTLLAGRFPDLKVGVAGLVLPLRDPRVVGKQIASVYSHTGGRLRIAYAIGNIPSEFEVLGVPYRRRGRIMNDYLEVVAKVTGGPSPIAHDGEFVQFSDGHFYPYVGTDFVWIAGNSDIAFKRIAKYATGWLPVYLTPEKFAQDRAGLAGHLSAAGRDIADVANCLEIFVTVQETSDAARDVAQGTMEHKFGSWEDGSTKSLVGDPEQVARRMHEYVTAGVDEFELKFVCHTIDDHIAQMELFAEEVRPRLHELTTAKR